MAKIAFAGIISGLLNGLFGSGGGVVAVILLRNILSDEKKAHASATLMILIMSILSLILYLTKGYIDFENGVKFIAGGIFGALLGTRLLKNTSNLKLKKFFSAVLVVSGLVMLFS